MATLSSTRITELEAQIDAIKRNDKLSPKERARAIEKLSDAILSECHAWRDEHAAHSETGRGSWRRKVLRERLTADIERPATSDTYAIEHAIRQAQAKLTKRQCQVWVMHRLQGMRQEDVAEIMGISHQAVSSLYARAKRAIAHAIQADHVFTQESGRRNHHNPPKRDPLPREIEPGRHALEAMRGVETLIQQEARSAVEVWLNGNPLEDDELPSNDDGIVSLSFAQVGSVKVREQVREAIEEEME